MINEKRMTAGSSERKKLLGLVMLGGEKWRRDEDDRRHK